MIKQIYKALINMFYSLNSDFIKSLEEYTHSEAHSTLKELIYIYSQIASPDVLIYVNELNNNNCITAQIEYIDFIDYMIFKTR